MQKSHKKNSPYLLFIIIHKAYNIDIFEVMIHSHMADLKDNFIHKQNEKETM